MADLAELALEGVPLVTEHYDKVYDPIKNKTKQGLQKVKSMRNGDGSYESEEEYEGFDRYGPPQRSQTDRRRRSPRDDYDDRRRRSGRGEMMEERYVYSKSNGRARSTGGGRGDHRKGLLIFYPFRQYLLGQWDRLTRTQEAEGITPTPNPPSPLPVANAENLWERKPLLH